jgi:hypothetical protein
MLLNYRFFANRFIESSLNPKSFAIFDNCNHRSVQPIIRLFHPSHIYTPVFASILETSTLRTLARSFLVATAQKQIPIIPLSLGII